MEFEIGKNTQAAVVVAAIFAFAALLVFIMDYPVVCTYELAFTAHPDVSASGTFHPKVSASGLLTASAPANSSVFYIQTLEPINLSVTDYHGDWLLDGSARADIYADGKVRGQVFCRDVERLLQAYTQKLTGERRSS